MKSNKLIFVLGLLLPLFYMSCKDEKKQSEGKEEVVVTPFDGAEGCGKFTTGGRGGAVYTVSSLEDNGAKAGTLRYALNQPGPLNIVFSVSGTIELKSELKIKTNNITIYGQSAPGDGICIKNYPVTIDANNVIIQFVHFRMGNVDFDGDALTCVGRKNILIDHCSMSWSTDECASCYGNTNFTMQWCMIYEGLNTDLKGNHGFGGIWGGSNVSFHHNLIANQSNRTPRFDHDYVSTMKGPLDFVNNVIYIVNSGNGTYGGESCNTTNTQRTINMVNNYYKYSSAAGSAAGRILNPTTSCSYCTKAMGCSTIVPGKFYIAGNYVEGYDSKTSDNWSAVSPYSSVMKSTEPFALSQEISKQTAQDAYTSVLAKAGASLVRDEVDARVISQVVNNTGTTISSVDSWPTYTSSTAPTDSDRDGIPNDWEDANGLDKANWQDYKNVAPSGRTYLEEYMQSLVKHLY